MKKPARKKRVDVRFPKSIYVGMNDEGEGARYFFADEAKPPHSMEDGDPVGIYELREVLTVRVKRSIE